MLLKLGMRQSEENLYKRLIRSRHSCEGPRKVVMVNIPFNCKLLICFAIVNHVKFS